MRETNFINQNKSKWIKFEKILQENKKDPEELSNLFIEITDDLSYSRTFYPNRSVRVYLNNLAQRVFYNIYKNRKSRFKRFLSFWTEDVPQILFESRFDLLLSFAIFALAVSIGVFSSIMDPEFPRIILGDAYVEMTLKNIEKGEPMSVYQDPDQTGMFMYIALNNLRVAFITFALGLLFGGGTIYILLFNGIMVGAFQYLFIREGVYLDSILTIWLHGAIEISCIVIAGAAGIHLGRGLLFPGTYTRLQGLQLSSRRALLIYITIVPLIIMAAFIEGFITRYSDASYTVRAILIIMSFVFMFGYFVWYPWRKAKRGFTANLREVNLPPPPNRKIDFKQIKNSGQIFTDAFNFYRKNLRLIASAAAAIAFVYTTVLMFIETEFFFQRSNALIFFFEAFYYTSYNAEQFLFLDHFGVHWFINVFGVAIMAFICLNRLRKYADSAKVGASYYIQTAVASITISAILNALMINYGEGEMSGLLTTLYLIFLFPIFILWLSVVFNEKTNLVKALGESFKLLAGNWPTMMGAYIVMVLMCFLFLFLSTAPIIDFYFNVVVTLLPFDENAYIEFYMAFNIFIYAFMLCFLFPLVFSVLSIAQHSFRETQTASDLMEKIPEIGNRKKSYGMARED
jgi:uncharacterized membrane protein SpoIIM required for sporulation